MINGVSFSKDWGETHDDAGQSGFDVLVAISDQFLDTGKELGHDDLLLHALVQVEAKVLDFVSSCCSNLSLAIFQQRLECGHKVCFSDIFANSSLEYDTNKDYDNVEKFKYSAEQNELPTFT